jgi:hypothetical protein
MRKWATKNAPQVKELALKELQGSTLRQIVDNIYGFLYNHFQYELDGAEQRLKSPACAWATRKEGMDCKSYSILASALLINLGVKHYFRRVKQPGQYQDKWTHVYVIVPTDQKNPPRQNPKEYLVIDATRHQNIEGRYLENSDSLMSKVSLRHVGLQAPSIGLNGCSCTPKPQPAPITYNPVPVSNSRDIRQNPQVASVGVVQPTSPTSSPTRSNITVTAPTRSTQQSTTVREVSTPTVRSSSTTTRTTATPRGGSSGSAGLAPSERLKGLAGLGYGLGFTQLANNPNVGQAGSATRVTEIPSSFLVTGAATAAANIATGINKGASASAIIKSTAGAVAGIVAALAPATGPGAPIALAVAAVIAIVPDRFWNKVIGQWFANGLRFSCMGSTWAPSRVKKEFAYDAGQIKLMFSEVLKDPNWDAIVFRMNVFMEFFYSVRATERHWLATSAKDCTRDGLKILIEQHNELKKELLQTFKTFVEAEGHTVVQIGTKNVTYPPDQAGRHSLTQEVEQYAIKLNTGKLATGNQETNTLMNVAQGGLQTANFGTSGVLMLLAIAGGAYYYKNKN